MIPIHYVVLSYDHMSDEAVVEEANRGDSKAEEYLINKYKNFVRAKGRSYYLIGGDKEDIIQEGMIGLFKAIRDYKADKAASFRAFADLCVTRQIITAIKTATRQKHIPLNSYVSLNKAPSEEGHQKNLVDTLALKTSMNPEDLMINKEELSQMTLRIDENLSTLESEILHLYLKGLSYQDMSMIMVRPIKSIDNALQRVRKKLVESL